MRQLIPSPRATVGDQADLSDADLDRLYGHPGPLVRLNVATTLDGSATGADGLSGSINTPADHRGFASMRRRADVVLVGAGTARAEGYRPGDRPLVVVSRRGQMPDQLVDDAEDGTRVALATCAASGCKPADDVWVCGDEAVDLAAVIGLARTTFGPHVLCEGGPSLAAELLAAGLVDEVALSWVPRLVGGTIDAHPRMLQGAAIDLAARPVHLLEEDATILGLWQIEGR